MSGEMQFVQRTCCYIHAIAWWKLELTDICKERTPQQRYKLENLTGKIGFAKIRGVQCFKWANG